MLAYLFVYKTFPSMMYQWKGFFMIISVTKWVKLMCIIEVDFCSWNRCCKEAPVYWACDCVTGSRLPHTVTSFKRLTCCAPKKLKKFKTRHFSIYVGTNKQLWSKWQVWRLAQIFHGLLYLKHLISKLLPKNINIILWVWFSIISALIVSTHLSEINRKVVGMVVVPVTIWNVILG